MQLMKVIKVIFHYKGTCFFFFLHLSEERIYLSIQFNKLDKKFNLKILNNEFLLIFFLSLVFFVSR